MSRVLAIDYGRKRVGLAVSDETRLAISRLPQLAFQGANFWDHLSKVITDLNPGVIVLGNPIFHSSIVNEVCNLQRYLQKRFTMPIILFDETGTSMQAEMLWHQLKPNTRKASHKKNNLDSLAAAMLLKRYLEHNR